MIDEFYKEIGARLVCIKKGTKSPNKQGWTKTEDRYEEASKAFDPEIHNKVGWVLDANHLVIDVDLHDDAKNGYSALEDLSEDLGIDLFSLATTIVKSPSGGCHLYFWKDPDIKIPKSSEKYAGLDFLSVGCQVIAAGSKHDSHDGEYYFEKKSDFLAPAPIATLNDALRADNRRSEETPLITYDGKECRPGDDFNKSRRALDILRSEMEKLGYTFKQVGDYYRFTRPNKTDQSFDHSGTLGLVSRFGNFELHSFSTSDTIFPAGKTITIFEAFRLINGWSDFTQATLHAADLGFGVQIDTSIIQQSVDDWLLQVPETKNKFDQLPSYEIAKRVVCKTFDELDDLASGLRRPYVIDGLLRVGEVMNVIAAPKVGKSWLVYNLALSTACGREFLGYSASKNLKVLLIDNELHWEELAWRMNQVASAMGVNPHDSLQVSCLRGMDISLSGIEKLLDEIGGDQFDLIIIDALYRVLPQGASENDNAQMTQLYNRLDGIAAKSNSAVICIHHTSKGAQGGKDVTDVGAGAGAISRAADTHLVIRPHRDEPYFVINALTRSGQSPEPVVAELDWPLWLVAEDVVPELKTEMSASKEDKKQSNIALCLDLIKRDGETTARSIADEMGVSESTIRSYIKDLERDGDVELTKAPYKPTIIRDVSADLRKQAEEWQPE